MIYIRAKVKRKKKGGVYIYTQNGRRGVFIHTPHHTPLPPEVWLALILSVGTFYTAGLGTAGGSHTIRTPLIININSVVGHVLVYVYFAEMCDEHPLYYYNISCSLPGRHG